MPMNQTVTHLSNGDFQIHKVLGIKNQEATQMAKDAREISKEAKKHKPQDRAVGSSLGSLPGGHRFESCSCYNH